MLIGGWTNPLELLKSEITQCEYEGRPVPEGLRQRAAQLHPEADAWNEAAIAPLNEELLHLPQDPAFPYVQPDDLVGIRKERPDGPRRLELKLSEAELLDRLHGAFTGRACGCALGKPVEGLGMRGNAKMSGRQAIRARLERLGDWELSDYFSDADLGDDLKIWAGNSCREKISHMESDDDINYTMIGLKVLEEKGPSFQWRDVADAWNSSLPHYAICTAERQAILNYCMRKPAATAEFTRRHNNPYREWIGAYIRADGWAYACAGNPELAAEFAWRDASWTHTANGIYGEMFMAAIIAAAFVVDDPVELIQIGLSEIPRNCRLAEAVREALAWRPGCPSFEDFMVKVEARHAGMHAVHTVNNALIVVMGMLYGGMEPDRTACLAVMGGLDTDCNGATAGSIAGAARGQAKFGGKLARRLNDTVKPQVFGFQECKFAELARRTLAVWKTVSQHQS